MPPALRAMPPKISSLLALIGAKLAAGWDDKAVVAICVYETDIPVVGPAISSVRRLCRTLTPERRHHMLCEHVLGLDALPMLQPAKIGHDCQLANSTLFL